MHGRRSGLPPENSDRRLLGIIRLPCEEVFRCADRNLAREAAYIEVDSEAVDEGSGEVGWGMLRSRTG